MRVIGITTLAGPIISAILLIFEVENVIYLGDQLISGYVVSCEKNMFSQVCGEFSQVVLFYEELIIEIHLFV
jgi:hypothetical protein